LASVTGLTFARPSVPDPGVADSRSLAGAPPPDACVMLPALRQGQPEACDLEASGDNARM